MSTPEDMVQTDAESQVDSPVSELEQLQAALAAAEVKAAEGRDQALRAMAELENVRRRAQRDVENAHKQLTPSTA